MCYMHTRSENNKNKQLKKKHTHTRGTTPSTDIIDFYIGEGEDIEI